jgi:hypothetical protein
MFLTFLRQVWSSCFYVNTESAALLSGDDGTRYEEFEARQQQQQKKAKPMHSSSFMNSQAEKRKQAEKEMKAVAQNLAGK